ncbi:MAG: chromate resistance protein [Actinobacteria bacterium]|nr:chromate resistance protein [Actinomycetota bacterium]
MAADEWVLLSYRLPREPSTTRVALWRRLRGLGVAKLGDGLVALPLDSRSREQFEWIADEVEQAGGEAGIWIGRPGSRRQERALVDALRRKVGEEYRELIALAVVAEAEPSKRALGKLRRRLRKVRRRDYFPPPEREQAEIAVEAVAAALHEVPV